MRSILSFDADRRTAVVEPGIVLDHLNAGLKKSGLWYPVDVSTSAQATLGGMASTRASGTTTVRYGSMRELVLGLTVVLPDGQVIRTGGRARKSSAGLDLTHLYIGSEGTLGVITEIQVRLHPVPESIVAAVCQFPDLDGAIGAAGEGLSDVLWRVVCAGETLPDAERALAWPARSGKVVLRIALDRVARFYRIF